MAACEHENARYGIHRRLPCIPQGLRLRATQLQPQANRNQGKPQVGVRPEYRLDGHGQEDAARGFPQAVQDPVHSDFR